MRERRGDKGKGIFRRMGNEEKRGFKGEGERGGGGGGGRGLGGGRDRAG